MSWKVGALVVLIAALGGGFWWYERARPDARIVALVGTLAAFAALGRIAFAAVPNVKPTTDIVLIAGYALGGGPGFAVGALAGLSSNFFFGQGPWTPWQMAAWGGTGVLGAVLARLPVRLGRWPLALVCCAAGFAFTVVQDVGDWVTYSDHSSAQLGVYVGQGLGFDAVHAAGCLVFALALGPALARSVQRFTRRLQVTWLPAASEVVPVLVIGLAVACGLGAGLGVAAPAARAASGTPASYLLGAQNADGGFGPAPGQRSDQLFAGWAGLGLAAAGDDLSRVTHGGPSLIAYVRSGARSLPDSGALERTILVVRAAGLSPRAFGGHDLVAELQRRLRRDGSVSEQVNWTAFAILALRSAGVPVPARTRRWLISQQDRDGGYSFAGTGAGSDVDDSGAALQALAGDPAAARARVRAVTFLRDQQNGDGGFPSQLGAVSNAQSTAWAVQGFDAAGVAAGSVHRAGSPSPPAYLRSLIAASGAVRYARGTLQTPVWVTGQVLMALAGKALPFAPPASVTAPAGKTPTPPPTATSTATTPAATTGSQATTTEARRASGSPDRRRPVPRPTPRPAVRRERAVVAARGRMIAGFAGFAGAAGVLTALLLAPLGVD
jgi:energy-coupling factor transport system substrate-specific component